MLVFSIELKSVVNSMLVRLGEVEGNDSRNLAIMSSFLRSIIKT